MWPWERKAYERGLADGKANAEQWVGAQVNEAVHHERQIAEATLAKALAKALDEQYRKLGAVLWEARREIPDDSPMHARIRKVLSNGREAGALGRIEAMFPGSVKRK